MDTSDDVPPDAHESGGGGTSSDGRRGRDRSHSRSHAACANGCPVCFMPYSAMALQLPSMQRSQSTLICRLSGAIMNEHNEPMVLPDGNVYSHRALRALAREQSDDGSAFYHPLTSERIRLDQLRKAIFL